MPENLNELLHGPLLSIRYLPVSNFDDPQHAIGPKCRVNGEEWARNQSGPSCDRDGHIACRREGLCTRDEVPPLRARHIVLSTPYAHASFHFSSILLQL